MASKIAGPTSSGSGNTGSAGWPVDLYLKLLGLLSLAAGLLLVLGFLPSRNLGGEVAVEAMWIGTGISWLACALAGIPLVGMGAGLTPHIRMLISTGLRVLVVVALTLVFLLGGLIPAMPLMIWVATSYFFLMFVDTGFAFWRLKRVDASATAPSALAGAHHPQIEDRSQVESPHSTE